MEAVTDYAAETGQPIAVVFEQARGCARESVLQWMTPARGVANMQLPLSLDLFCHSLD